MNGDKDNLDNLDNLDDRLMNILKEQNKLKYDIISKLNELQGKNDIVDDFLKGYFDISHNMQYIDTKYTYSEYYKWLSTYLENKLPTLISVIYKDNNKAYILMDAIKDVFMDDVKQFYKFRTKLLNIHLIPWSMI